MLPATFLQTLTKPLSVLALTLWLICPSAWAAESPTQAEIPAPATFVGSETISLAVVLARPDDAGFKALLNTAWEGIRGIESEGNNYFIKLVLKAIQGDSENALLKFLPVQMVRADAMGEDGRPHPTLAVTVVGWQGLQNFFYLGLSQAADGSKHPTKDYEAATLVLREAWEDPARSHVLTRKDGTFVSFPTIEKAEQVIERMDKKVTTLPETDLGRIYATLDRVKDTYGVLLNRDGSMFKFLTWLNKVDATRIRESVGSERLDRVLGQVHWLSWEGDLVSDDEMRFLVRFETDSKEARQELVEILKESRDVLEQYGRAGELQISGLRNQVMVDFSMLGYRQMLKNYIDNEF